MKTLIRCPVTAFVFGKQLVHYIPASPLHSFLCFAKGPEGFFTCFQDLGDTQPAAGRVCSRSCATRQCGQSLGSWREPGGSSFGPWKECVCVSR